MAPHGSQALDYEACSADELRGFVESRMGKFSRGSRRGRPKKLYIATLHRLDKDLTFHQFLDLPPELRLLIYRELLVVGKSATELKLPDTAIFRTCKLLKKEAEDVFYGDNEANFELKVLDNDSTRIVLVPGIYHCWKRTESPRSIRSALQGLSPRLARFRHVHVEFRLITTLQEPGNREMHHEARFQCSVLASFLAQTRAHAVTVQLVSPSSVFEMNFYMLQPLAQLGSEIKVTFTGVPHDEADRLKALTLSAACPHDICVDKVLFEWFKTSAEVQEELDRMGATGKEVDRVTLQTHLDTIEDRFYKLEYYNAKAEQRLCEAISILKRILSEHRMGRLGIWELEPSSTCSIRPLERQSTLW